MNHLLDIEQLAAAEVQALVDRALSFKRSGSYPAFPKARLANLFYENSTRTRISFELAAHHLGIPIVNFAPQLSSESKGETSLDTIQTLAAMGINLFVIRHSQSGAPADLAARVSKQSGLHIINAGDGTHAHPTQALLDIMTICEQHASLSQLKVAILGNICHSRVANSLISLFGLLGIAELRLIAPEPWLPKTAPFGQVTTSLKEGLAGVDVVICLRVQRERFSAEDGLDLNTYHQDYALTTKSLAYAKTKAMVMHPGPINRGVEIDSDVADGPQSFILRQTQNGVFMRMAVIERILTAGS